MTGAKEQADTVGITVFIRPCASVSSWPVMAAVSVLCGTRSSSQQVLRFAQTCGMTSLELSVMTLLGGIDYLNRTQRPLIRCHHRISRQQHDPFDTCLGHKHAVEGVFADRREAVDGNGVLAQHRQIGVTVVSKPHRSMSGCTWKSLRCRLRLIVTSHRLTALKNSLLLG